jgi:hypothetical protein
VSIGGMVGLGVAVHSGYVYTVLFLSTVMYFAAPFLKEP